MKPGRVRILSAAGAIALLASLGAGSNAMADQLEVTTNYGYSLPAGILTPNGGPSPDTGWVTFTNVSSSTFTGVFFGQAVSNFGGDTSFSSGSVTLLPGQSFGWAINAESSNQGGYNSPYNNGTPQPGVILSANGAFSDSTTLNATINDSQIHSGVFQTNPYGVSLDNYVLQGGDPFGRDTGDAFETTQAQGKAFLGTAPGPLPGAGLPSLIALVVAGALAWTRKFA